MLQQPGGQTGIDEDEELPAIHVPSRSRWRNAVLAALA
jgi:hypothetical protein